MARKKLYDMEREAVRTGTSKETAELYRPTKNEDPAMKLGVLMLGVFRMFLENAEIEIGIGRNNNAEIADFTFKCTNTGETG